MGPSVATVTRPPLLLLVAYRMFAWRLGPAYREWTYDDITRRGYTFRQALPVGVVVGGLLAAVFAVTGSDPRRAVPPIVGVLVLAFFLRKALRERALRQQGLSPAGDAEAAWFTDDAERRKRNINGAVLTTTLVIAGVILLGVRGD
ncbi:MAG: hypothetical protein QOJ79_246 [Actinomycetota bacterium]|jgi:hypothetical protein|nr:hypothetical protein [Actinomycetota bacterium]